MITEHTICALPEGHRDYRHYAIKVQRRGNGMWVLNWGGMYFDGNGDWLPSLTDACDFDEQEALRVADRLAPTLEVNGYTVSDALGRESR